MKISEYVKLLNAIKKEHGDLEVEAYVGGRITANPPKVAYTRVLKGRESKPDFWSNYMEEDRKGEKVIYL